MFKKDGQKKAPVNVNQLVQEVLALMQGDLRNQQVSLRTELEEQPILVLGDRVQLQQVILNLITNAIDAMGSITERPRLLQVRSEIEEIRYRDHSGKLRSRYRSKKHGSHL